MGKTTTALNLSVAFAIAEKRTLLIDSDPQAHSTTGAGVKKTLIHKTLYDGLRGNASINELTINGGIDFFKIIPSRMELARAEAELLFKADKETVLRDLIKAQKEDYDFILIDCPPSLNLLMVNALTASDSMIIPLQCEFYASEGLDQFLKNYDVFKKMFNPDIRIEGILLTMVDEKYKSCWKIAEYAKNRFNGMIFNTFIPRDRNFPESAHLGKPLMLYDITSPGARSYLELAREIISRGGRV